MQDPEIVDVLEEYHSLNTNYFLQFLFKKFNLSPKVDVFNKILLFRLGKFQDGVKKRCGVSAVAAAATTSIPRGYLLLLINGK